MGCWIVGAFGAWFLGDGFCLARCFYSLLFGRLLSLRGYASKIITLGDIAKNNIIDCFQVILTKAFFPKDTIEKTKTYVLR